MKQLLNNSRILNKLLRNSTGTPVDYMQMAEALGMLVEANTYLTGPTGKILGYHFMAGHDCPELETFFHNSAAISSAHNGKLLAIKETVVNRVTEQKICILGEMNGQACPYSGKIGMIVPIVVSGARQGTLVLTRFEGLQFEDKDIILSEYAATLIGMEILRSRSERIEDEARTKATLQIAKNALSFSELEAVEHIFKDVENEETILVASKIADEIGITRSVIVNALRKLESAGVIETKSLGMKGTFIRVINKFFLEDIK